MKLSYTDRIQIYEIQKQGVSISNLSKQYQITRSNLRCLIKLIDLYGRGIARKGKNTYYSPELKQEIIDKVLVEGDVSKSNFFGVRTS